MPSEGQPAQLRERERFPDVKEAIGEDPARFLDPQIYHPELRDSVPLVAKSRILGIDRLEVIGAWQGVERRLGEKRSVCPREEVLRLLANRREVLIAEGGREEKLQQRLEAPDDVEKGTAYAIRDGERVPLAEAQRAAGERSVGAATDGGVDE